MKVRAFTGSRRASVARSAALRSGAATSALAATAKIPILFIVGIDPVELGWGWFCRTSRLRATETALSRVCGCEATEN
jgi:hypothetical protein